MNHLEQQLDYPFGETLPESGKTVEIAPGVLWIRMGLPFALNHINLWLLEDEVETAQGGYMAGQLSIAASPAMPPVMPGKCCSVICTIICAACRWCG
jgi:hypothetical protein